MPDDLEAGDARRHRRVAGRSRAARCRSACAARTGPRRASPAAARRSRARARARGLRASRRRAAAGRRRRGRGAPSTRSGATKRTGANMRAPAATAARQTISSRRLPRQHGERAGHVDAAAARARCSRASSTMRASAITASRTPRRSRARCASAIRPSPQTLSRGKACWSTSTTSRPARASHCAAGAAPAGTGADDEHVAARREARSKRGSCDGHGVRSAWTGLGPAVPCATRRPRRRR